MFKSLINVLATGVACIIGGNAYRQLIYQRSVDYNRKKAIELARDNLRSRITCSRYQKMQPKETVGT